MELRVTDKVFSFLAVLILFVCATHHGTLQQFRATHVLFFSVASSL